MDRDPADQRRASMRAADYFWPVWPILGFLIAIGWQAFAVYGPGAADDDRR